MGWTNLNIAFSGIDPNGYYFPAMQAVVDAGGLAKFAKSPAEKLFITKTNVSTLFVPDYLADSDGHNSGNLLTCLWMRESIGNVIISLMNFHFCFCFAEGSGSLMLMLDILQPRRLILLAWSCDGCVSFRHMAPTLCSFALLPTAPSRSLMPTWHHS